MSSKKCKPKNTCKPLKKECKNDASCKPIKKKKECKDNKCVKSKCGCKG